MHDIKNGEVAHRYEERKLGMVDIERRAEAVWTGDLWSGKGHITSTSGALQNADYSYATRFEFAPGTNPEELLAAAHAACYSMALSAALGTRGYKPENIQTRAICTVSSQESGGFKITGMQLNVRARVPEIKEEIFLEIIKDADQGCPVSNVLRKGLDIEIHASLVK